VAAARHRAGPWRQASAAYLIASQDSAVRLRELWLNDEYTAIITELRGQRTPRRMCGAPAGHV